MRLILRLFALHRQREAGEIPPAQWRRRTEKLREQLQTARCSAHAHGAVRTAALAEGLDRHWESYWLFLEQTGVEPSNNRAPPGRERALRKRVLWRKRSFGHQSERRKYFAEVMLAVCGTLALQTRNVLESIDESVPAGEGSVNTREPPRLLAPG